MNLTPLQTDKTKKAYFCRKCGTPLQEVSRKLLGYVLDTGLPIFSVSLKCPNTRWFDSLLETPHTWISTQERRES